LIFAFPFYLEKKEEIEMIIICETSSLSTIMTYGDHACDIINIVHKKEGDINSGLISKRAIDLGANFDQHEGFYLLDHQGEISEHFRSKEFVFADWQRHHRLTRSIFPAFFVFWNSYSWRWRGCWGHIESACCRDLYIVRRCRG